MTEAISTRGLRAVSPAWRAALIGTLAALPATVLIDRLPNGEATIGAGIMVIGAAIAGVVAEGTKESGAAGIRAGFLGGVIDILVLGVTIDPAVIRQPNQLPFLMLAVLAVLCVWPLFGLAFGRLGGWIKRSI